MKRYFWYRYGLADKAVAKRRDGRARQSAGNLARDGEAAFWGSLALKPVGSKIRIPKREFIKPTPDLQKAIFRRFQRELTTLLAP